MSNDVLNKALKKLQSVFGENVSTLAKDPLRMRQRSIPTGLDVLDHYLIGCGGWPVGRIVELFSEEGGGKSSLAYAAIAEAQKLGGVVALADTEYSLSADRAFTFGVDPEAVIQLQPTHMEECLQQIQTAVEANPTDGPPGLVIWDSLAATPTEAEVNSGVAPEKGFDTRAKLLSQSFRILGEKVAEHQVCLIVINQPRQKIGVMFGDPTTTPGGQALKSHASLRLQLYRGKAAEVSGQKIGQFVTISAKKNRYAPPRKLKARLDYEDGWNNDWTVLELAKELKLLDARARGADALEAAYANLGHHYPGFLTVKRDPTVTKLDEVREGDGDASE